MGASARDVVDTYVRAVNAGDLDQLLSLFADDGRIVEIGIERE